MALKMGKLATGEQKSGPLNHRNLMGLNSTTPILWVFVSLAVAGIGCISALWSWVAVSAEKKKVRQAKADLTPEEAWNGGYALNEQSLRNWLISKGIPESSYIGDYIRACWSAWLGNRSASLAELHSLVSRREKIKIFPRLSGSIAALLLVIGIIGTLSSVHPILKAFRFRVSADGELQDAAASTDLVNSLINHLGEAFLPSLWALAGTIAVVVCRGCYFHALHNLTLELDRFAFGSLLPRYRPRSISEEYGQVKTVLTALSESIKNREDNFEKVVRDLNMLVEGIGPAMNTLTKTAVVTEAASEKLSARTKSVSDGISRNLGKNSPMFKAVSGFEAVFFRTEETMNALKSTVEEIGATNRAERADMKAIVAGLEQSVKDIKADHELDRNTVSGTVSEFKNWLISVPKSLRSIGESAVQQGMEKLKAGLDRMREDSHKSQALALEHLNIQAAEMRNEVNQVVNNLPGHLERVEAVLKGSKDVEIAAVGAINGISAQASQQIESLVEESKLSVRLAQESLRRQSDEGSATLRATALETSNSASKKLSASADEFSQIAHQIARNIGKVPKRRRWYWPFGKRI